jgi:enediyne biosynthesis protein E3
MPSKIGSLLNRILGPDPADVTFEKRGWPSPGKEKQANLEKVAGIFLTGFSYGMVGSDIPEIEASLESIERPFRGFAYEGCGMAMGVRDSLRPFGQHWVSDYFAGRAKNHIYMAHIGVGWAMARVPKMRWRTIARTNDILGWLALDGWGFHQAYYYTNEYVDQQKQLTLPVFRPVSYANRVVDQGIGRALWFIKGSSPAGVAQTIERFHPSRRGDLWSGAALATVYAGGVGVSDLEEFARLSGEYFPDVAQGAVFAGMTRLKQDLVIPHTQLAVKVYCDMTVEEAGAVFDDASSVLTSDDPETPVFEVWRQRIRKNFE